MSGKVAQSDLPEYECLHGESGSVDGGKQPPDRMGLPGCPAQSCPVAAT